MNTHEADPKPQQPTGDGELRNAINSELLQYKAELVNGFNQASSGKTAAELSTTRLERLFAAHLNTACRAAVREAEKITGDTSDGYHTFNELYSFRKVYNALLFNEWAMQRRFNVYRSKLHSDGELPFGSGWFVVGAQLPTGQITNHYELKDWDLFTVPELPRATIWDGHTPQQALERMLQLLDQSTPTADSDDLENDEE